MPTSSKPRRAAILTSRLPRCWPHPLAEAIERRYVSEDQDRSRHFYICGVGDIVPQLRDLLRRAGYERRAVQYEKW